MSNSLKICCLSCKKTLTNDDNLQNHLNHKITTSQHIFTKYQDHQNQFYSQLKKDVDYLASINKQKRYQKSTRDQLIDDLLEEIISFQSEINKRLNKAATLLLDLKSKNNDDDHYIKHLEILKQSFLQPFNDNMLETLINLTENPIQTQKDLKETCQESLMKMQLNLAQEFKFLLPKQYLTQLKNEYEDKFGVAKYIKNKIKILCEDTKQRIETWNDNVLSYLMETDQETNCSLNIISSKMSNYPRRPQKVVIYENQIMIASSQEIQIFNLHTQQLEQKLQFKQMIEDVDIDSTRNMLCVCTSGQIQIYQLKSLKLFRVYKIAIELGKAVTIKFLENQVCLGSGITLEFFPLGGQLQRFTQQINFSSYWDRISVVDYVVNNGAEMLLIVGTVCGMLCLFNSSFKELYQKQHHQARIQQIKFVASKKYGKLLLTNGEDQRINISVVEGIGLKQLKTIRCQNPIGGQINLLIMKEGFMITQRSQGMLQFMKVNDQLEAFDLATQIQEDDEWIEYGKEAFVGMWQDNKMVVINDSNLLMGTILRC